MFQEFLFVVQFLDHPLRLEFLVKVPLHGRLLFVQRVHNNPLNLPDHSLAVPGFAQLLYPATVGLGGDKSHLLTIVGLRVDGDGRQPVGQFVDFLCQLVDLTVCPAMPATLAVPRRWFMHLEALLLELGQDQGHFGDATDEYFQVFVERCQVPLGGLFGRVIGQQGG